MPDVVNGAPERGAGKRGKYAHLFKQVADKDQAIAFRPDELPRTGINSVRSTARDYGYRITVDTVDGVHYVRVYTKELMLPDEADAATAAAELARRGKK